jgi:hypothetical protein
MSVSCKRNKSTLWDDLLFYQRENQEKNFFFYKIEYVIYPWGPKEKSETYTINEINLDFNTLNLNLRILTNIIRISN